jgi:hypothetical protein
LICSKSSHHISLEQDDKLGAGTACNQVSLRV